jgi:hypothetical protein
VPALLVVVLRYAVRDAIGAPLVRQEAATEAMVLMLEPGDRWWRKVDRPGGHGGPAGRDGDRGGTRGLAGVNPEFLREGFAVADPTGPL